MGHGNCSADTGCLQGSGKNGKDPLLTNSTLYAVVPVGYTEFVGERVYHVGSGESLAVLHMGASTTTVEVPFGSLAASMIFSGDEVFLCKACEFAEAPSSILRILSGDPLLNSSSA